MSQERALLRFVRAALLVVTVLLAALVLIAAQAYVHDDEFGWRREMVRERVDGVVRSAIELPPLRTRV